MRVSDHVRLLAFGLAIHMTGLLAAQGPPPRPAAAGPAVDDQAVLDRYRGALERNPRRGTALDRLYGLHVEQGRLDQLIDGYRDREEITRRRGRVDDPRFARSPARARLGCGASVS